MNKNTLRTRERIKRNPKGHLLSRVQARAKRTGKECTISLEDITIPEMCPVFNIPLRFEENCLTDNSISMDRIDNTKGYIKNNVQVISNKANTMKQSATPEELVQFADWVYRTYVFKS